MREQAPPVHALNGLELDGVPVIKFTPCEEYTTFRAEYAIVDDALVFHFFVTAEHPQWPSYFPDVLSTVAQDYFNATYPRLTAAFTRELNSWWFRANGFAEIGDPHLRAMRFYARLDAALEQHGK